MISGRKIASSEEDEMIGVFNVVEQHVAFRNICDDVWIQEQSAKGLLQLWGFLVRSVDIGGER